MIWLIWCAPLVSWFCFALHLFLPTNLCLTGSLAGITLCSFVLLPRHGFVINLFFILLSGRSAVGNMPVGGLKLWICHMFLSQLESLTLEFVSIWAPLTFSNGKLQKLALSVWVWILVSFFSIFLFFRSVFASFSSSHSATLFSSGVSALPWRSNPVYSLA